MAPASHYYYYYYSGALNGRWFEKWCAHAEGLGKVHCCWDRPSGGNGYKSTSTASRRTHTSPLATNDETEYTYVLLIFSLFPSSREM
jgi:hypothetical protein